METDYIDNYQVRAYNPEMLAGHLAPGGSVEALEKLKAEGVIRAIGVTGHSSVRVLTDAIKTGRIDTVLFPLNCLQDEAWAELDPDGSGDGRRAGHNEASRDRAPADDPGAEVAVPAAYLRGCAWRVVDGTA